MSEKGRKDKNQNIQVFVRLRPLNQRERDIKSLGVVDVVNNREVVVRQSQTSHTKKFTFDKAFGPYAKQVEVYQDVVSPLIEEVLNGYNCTVFAYGQTGTGKTHTMVGENSGDETTWQSDPLAGIIPRALSQLFDELRISNTEYTVRVSYLELYNEELFDLLSSSEDNSKLRIYEDVTRKGSNIVNGLEEITVYNKNEVYKIMSQGQERKRVACTLMNAQSSNLPNGKPNTQSSRSHTVFTIVVHMKENSPEGEELVKIGKLNLVDLAGSENINKAGSDNPAKRERARECVNINQSLLTLGRVITALVERHPHIPYRESKLTRILQESLGGRTKTSIIATISPGHKDVEETMSTLEYAQRAKNIQNKPEVNQKMTKKAILKEYAEEIDRLKRDLQAARDKNGVYLANETFAEMALQQEEQRKEIQELLLQKRAIEEERDRMQSIFEELNHKLEERVIELNSTKSRLHSTKEKLVNTSNLLKTTKLHFEEQKHLVNKHRDTEVTLTSQATQLIQAADTATNHVANLHDTVDRRRTLESSNLETTKIYHEQSSKQRDTIINSVGEFADRVLNAISELQVALDTYTTNNVQTYEQNKQNMEELVRRFVTMMNEIQHVTTQTQTHLYSMTSTHNAQLKEALNTYGQKLQEALSSLIHTVAKCVQQADNVDLRGNVDRFVQQWYTGSSERVTSLQRAHSAFETRFRDAASARCVSARRHRDNRRAHVDKRNRHIQSCIDEIQQEKAQIEQRLANQLCEIESERKESESRLNEWVEEEKRLLEERLAKHVAMEKEALENRLQKKLQEIEQEKEIIERRVSKYVEWQKMQLEANREEIEIAEGDLEESERGQEMCMTHVTRFAKEFVEGTSAIGIDMEALVKNVVEVVDHIGDQLVTTLHEAKGHIEREANNMVETNRQTAEQLTLTTDSIMNNIVSDTKQAVDIILDNIETNNSSTIEQLTTLSSSTQSLISTSHTHRASQSSTLEAAYDQLKQLRVSVVEGLRSHAELEGRYLMQEYRVYSPSGSTPVRQQYNYPRVLTATSPYDRILTRFRAMRQNSYEDDCILIESDGELPRGSDSESSLSEDSTLASTIPSPPTVSLQLTVPSPPTDLHDTAIIKSTSESDIYRPQGKENADRLIQYRKPSKLPAPTSHKTPLLERNNTVN